MKYIIGGILLYFLCMFVVLLIVAAIALNVWAVKHPEKVDYNWHL